MAGLYVELWRSKISLILLELRSVWRRKRHFLMWIHPLPLWTCTILWKRHQATNKVLLKTLKVSRNESPAMTPKMTLQHQNVAPTRFFNIEGFKERVTPCVHSLNWRTLQHQSDCHGIPLSWSYSCEILPVRLDCRRWMTVTSASYQSYVKLAGPSSSATILMWHSNGRVQIKAFSARAKMPGWPCSAVILITFGNPVEGASDHVTERGNASTGYACAETSLASATLKTFQKQWVLWNVQYMQEMYISWYGTVSNVCIECHDFWRHGYSRPAMADRDSSIESLVLQKQGGWVLDFIESTRPVTFWIRNTK